MMPLSRVLVRLRRLKSIKKESPARCFYCIDILIEVPRLDYQKLSSDRLGETSETIRWRVQAAKDIQRNRFTNPDSQISNNNSSSDIICNADMRVGRYDDFAN